tara:strand:+ start:2609 stop:3025 length:417 start_codon:yes stop_codon:yes gene_type:complete
VDQRIIDFINGHHLLTLATSKDNIPYCSNAFYVFDAQKKSLIFSSDSRTKHVQDFIVNPKVAASIALETKIVKKIKGVQILGDIIEIKGDDLEKATKQYLKAFPYARLMKLQLWEMELTFVKMTHNRLGFGKKLIWEK